MNTKNLLMKIFTLFSMLGTSGLISIGFAQTAKPPTVRVYPVESFHSLPGISRQFEVVLLTEAAISGNVIFMDSIYPIRDQTARISVHENKVDFFGVDEKTIHYEGKAKTSSSGKSYSIPFEFSITYRKPNVSIGTPNSPTIFQNCLNILHVDTDGYPKDEWDLHVEIVANPGYADRMLDEFDLPKKDFSDTGQGNAGVTGDNFRPSPPMDTIFFSRNTRNRIAIVPSSRNIQMLLFAIKKSTGDSVMIERLNLNASPPPRPRVTLINNSGKVSQVFTRKDSVVISIQPDDDFKNAMPWEGRYDCNGVELYSVMKASSKEKDGGASPLPINLIRIKNQDNQLEYAVEPSYLVREEFSIAEDRTRIPVELVKRSPLGNQYAFSISELLPGQYLLRIKGINLNNGLGQIFPVDFEQENLEFRIIVI